MVLLNRSRLSMIHNEYMDASGNVFILYPVRSIAASMNMAVSTIETALNDLEKNHLIERRMTKEGLASHIYVKLPEESSAAVPDIDTLPVKGVPNSSEKTCAKLDLTRTVQPVHSNNNIIKNNNSNILCTDNQYSQKRIEKKEINQDLNAWLRQFGNKIVDDSEQSSFQTINADKTTEGTVM